MESKDIFPAGLRVLVVDDDPLCLRILEEMLQRCAYVVTTCQRATTALALLRENKNKFDLVISDVIMPDMDGFKLLELVGLEMDLPVIMMSANGETINVMKGITHGACDYLLKPVRMEELRNIWQHVVRKRRDVSIAEHSGSLGHEEKVRQQRSDTDEHTSSANGPNTEKDTRKRKEPEKDEQELEEKEVGGSDDPANIRKPRVVWTVELHQLFINAVNQLGYEKAVPKRILELMNVSGLTRENVASHLQKYRLYLKRLQSVAEFGVGGGAFGASGGKEGRFGGPGAAVPFSSKDLHMDPLSIFQGGQPSLGPSALTHLVTAARLGANGGLLSWLATIDPNLLASLQRQDENTLRRTEQEQERRQQQLQQGPAQASIFESLSHDLELGRIAQLQQQLSSLQQQLPPALVDRPAHRPQPPALTLEQQLSLGQALLPLTQQRASGAATPSLPPIPTSSAGPNLSLAALAALSNPAGGGAAAASPTPSLLLQLLAQQGQSQLEQAAGVRGQLEQAVGGRGQLEQTVGGRGQLEQAVGGRGQLPPPGSSSLPLVSALQGQGNGLFGLVAGGQQHLLSGREGGASLADVAGKRAQGLCGSLQPEGSDSRLNGASVLNQLEAQLRARAEVPQFGGAAADASQLRGAGGVDIGQLRGTGGADLQAWAAARPGEVRRGLGGPQGQVAWGDSAADDPRREVQGGACGASARAQQGAVSGGGPVPLAQGSLTGAPAQGGLAISGVARGQGSAAGDGVTPAQGGKASPSPAEGRRPAASSAGGDRGGAERAQEGGAVKHVHTAARMEPLYSGQTDDLMAFLSKDGGGLPEVELQSDGFQQLENVFVKYGE